MKLLCKLSNSEIRVIAHQVFTDMLESYEPLMLDFYATAAPRDLDKAIDEDEELEGRAGESDLDDNVTVDNVDVEELQNLESGSATHYYSMKQAAVMFTTLAKAVFQVTGWGGGCNRRSFGTSCGCNMKRCLVGHSDVDRAIWTRSEIPGKAKSYMRRPQRCTIDERTGTRNLLSFGHNDRQFRLTLDDAEELGPKEGDMVSTSIEVLLDGPVKHPYGRFPEIGYFEDHTRLNQMRISISWKSDNGQWYKRYVQASHRGSSEGEFVPTTKGVYMNASTVMGLINFLEQTTFRGKHPYMRDIGVARLKISKWDFLKQELRIKERRLPRPVAVPSTRRGSEIIADLFAVTSRSETRVGGWMAWPIGRGHDSDDRKECDRCHVAKDLLEQNSTVRCKKMPDRDLCTVCHAFGSPVCTWSSNDTLEPTSP